MAISLPVVECVNHCRSFWVRNGALRGDEEPNICLYLYVIHNEKSRCNLRCLLRCCSSWDLQDRDCVCVTLPSHPLQVFGRILSHQSTHDESSYVWSRHFADALAGGVDPSPRRPRGSPGGCGRGPVCVSP